MKYYIELTILPGADIGLNFIWGRMFHRLHIGFVDMKELRGGVSVGVGFPGYRSRYPLGNKVRLFSQSEEDLTYLNIENRLRGLTDYIHVKSIKSVPDNIKSFCCYRRQPVKTNKELLVRRRQKRHEISYDQALDDYKNFKPKSIDTPFIHIISASNGGRFPLFILKEERDSEKYEGFGTYGLSRVSTVPEFK